MSENVLLSRAASFLLELLVQLSQLLQKAPVGDDPSAFLYVLDGVHHRHVLVDHEIGKKKRGGATPSHHTVHQQFI